MSRKPSPKRLNETIIKERAREGKTSDRGDRYRKFFAS
jgi:hypothetical protein